jgi:hypothetical protein
MENSNGQEDASNSALANHLAALLPHIQNLTTGPHALSLQQLQALLQHIPTTSQSISQPAPCTQTTSLSSQSAPPSSQWRLSATSDQELMRSRSPATTPSTRPTAQTTHASERQSEPSTSSLARFLSPSVSPSHAAAVTSESGALSSAQSAPSMPSVPSISSAAAAQTRGAPITPFTSLHMLNSVTGSSSSGHPRLSTVSGFASLVQNANRNRMEHAQASLPRNKKVRGKAKKSPCLIGPSLVPKIADCVKLAEGDVKVVNLKVKVFPPLPGLADQRVSL